MHAQRAAELDEAKAAVELLKTRETQQREIVDRANEDIRLQEQRVAELEQRMQQASGAESDLVGVELQEARDRLENTRSVQVTDGADLQSTQARLAESTRAVEIRTGQVDALAEELIMFENSSGRWATEKARRLEAEAKALEERAPEIEKQWEAHEAGQQPPGDATDLGTITVTASAADAVTEGRRQRATELEAAAGDAEGRGFADRNSAEDRRELGARHEARGRELEVQIGAAERRETTLSDRLSETDARHAQLGEQLARQEATLAQLDERGDADGAAVMRARIAQTREQQQNDQGRADTYRRDREDVQRDLEGMRTESARVTKEADGLRSEAEILEARAQGSLEDAATQRRVASVQDRIAAEVEQAKATGEHTRVRFVDPEDGREVTLEIPGAVTRPSGEPKEVTIDTTVPPAPTAQAPAATDATAAPADEQTPAEDQAPADEQTPAEDQAPADEQTPAEDQAPADEQTPAEDQAPADEQTPADDQVPADDQTPAEGQTPPGDGTPGSQSPTDEMPGADVDDEEESSRTSPPAPAPAAATTGPVTTAANDLSLTMPAAAAMASGSQDWDFTVDPAPAVSGSSGLDLGGGDPLDPSLLEPGDLAAEGDPALVDPTFDDPTLTGEDTTGGYGEAPMDPAGVSFPDAGSSYDDGAGYDDTGAGYGDPGAGFGDPSGYGDTDAGYGDDQFGGGSTYEDGATEETVAEPFADS